MSDAAETVTADVEEPLNPEGVSDERAKGLAEETLRRREVALQHVRKFGDPVLKSRASEIRSFGPELQREAQGMIALMHDAIGVGLAATQLGVMHRLLVIQAGPDATPTAIANPEIEWLSEEVAIAEEGCLSIPRVSVDVERPLFARVSGRGVTGEPLLIEASGLEARVLQHEIDHLDGVLMIDRSSKDQRKAALRALREGTSYSPSADEAVGEESQAGAMRTS
jgi:peptide deformylase